MDPTKKRTFKLLSDNLIYLTQEYMYNYNNYILYIYILPRTQMRAPCFGRSLGLVLRKKKPRGEESPVKAPVKAMDLLVPRIPRGPKPSKRRPVTHPSLTPVFENDESTETVLKPEQSLSLQEFLGWKVGLIWFDDLYGVLRCLGMFWSYLEVSRKLFLSFRSPLQSMSLVRKSSCDDLAPT